MAVALEVGWGNDELGLASRMSKKRAWGDDHQKLLEMMMGKSVDESTVGAKHTLDLLGSSSSSSTVTAEEQSDDFLELGQDVPLPTGWEKRLDLKSGTVFFINLNTGKSTRDDPRQSQSSCHFSLELLQSNQQLSNNDSDESLKRKCLNSWPEIESDPGNYQSSSASAALDLKLNLSTSIKPDSQLDSPPPQPHWLLNYSSKPCSAKTPATSSSSSMPESSNKVTLTCCKRCLMYVMISQSDPRCPKCASSVVIDFPMPKKPRINLEL